MKKVLDYNCRFDLSRETYTQFNCWLNLDWKDVINCLKADLIIINDKHYRVPREQLFDCLLTNKFGLLNLTLTEYKEQ
jgi:hypothetical protein